jgi:hypothetical protein
MRCQAAFCDLDIFSGNFPVFGGRVAYVLVKNFTKKAVFYHSPLPFCRRIFKYFILFYLHLFIDHIAKIFAFSIIYCPFCRAIVLLCNGKQ